MNQQPGSPLKILAVEPYYGGSHRAFLDGWEAHSRHQFTLLGLKPYKWKWRMRHAPLTCRDLAADLGEQDWDLLFVSDMLNLAEFRGLAPASLQQLPAVVYFHENQLTYPVRREEPRDLHFAFTNLVTAVAADEAWFNSHFHREEFFAAQRELLARMPDYQPLDAVERVAETSRVEPPGVEELSSPPRAADGPLRVVWAARWEHDKNPEAFFQALDKLAAQGIDFRLSVLGESFRDVPPVFAQAQTRWSDRIEHWGYQPARQDYLHALQTADVFVSTAAHEFFGISAVEAIACGCYPLLPRRLAYPEVLELEKHPECQRFFYDGCGPELAARLKQCAAAKAAGNLWQGAADVARNRVRRFFWPQRAARLDEALDRVRQTHFRAPIESRNSPCDC